MKSQRVRECDTDAAAAKRVIQQSRTCRAGPHVSRQASNLVPLQGRGGGGGGEFHINDAIGRPMGRSVVATPGTHSEVIPD